MIAFRILFLAPWSLRLCVCFYFVLLMFCY